MERIRSLRPDQDASLETIGPLPTRSSLLELLEAVRSPGVLRTDVDALLRGLASPLAEDETPRARADCLLFLIESPEVGGMQGTLGRTVRAAALQALFNMGYPYALEIPPEALSEVPRRLKRADQQIPIAGLIATLTGLIAQCSATLPWLLTPRNADSGLFIMIVPGMVLGPAASAVLGGWLQLRELQRFGLFSMAITGGLWLAGFYSALIVSLSPLSQPETWLFLVAGLGLLLGAVLMRRPEWLAQDSAPSKDSPSEPSPEAPPTAERSRPPNATSTAAHMGLTVLVTASTRAGWISPARSARGCSTSGGPPAR